MSNTTYTSAETKPTPPEGDADEEEGAVENGPGTESSKADISDSENEDGPILEKDDVFHILQNERRRQVLEQLRDVEETVDMREIAEKIAAWENDTTVENLYSDQRQRVYIALYQSHLPKLDDLGVIDYNQPRGTIEPTSLVEEVAKYLDVDSNPKTSEFGSERHPAYEGIVSTVGIGAAAVIVGGAAFFGLLPISLVGTTLAGVIAGVIVAITIAVAYR